MKIQEGLKLKGFPAEIPDSSRDDLPLFFKERGYKVGAEIGVYEGEFTEKICRVGLKMYAIDPWNDRAPHLVNNRKYDKADDTYKNAKKRLAKYNCELIKKASMEAVKDFADESLDFVYIDGDHSFRAVAEDLTEWSRKVKKGGVIAGHDYYVSKDPSREDSVHVKPVVDAFVCTFGIDNFWVLGERFSSNRDKWRSFLWIKE